MKKITDDIVKAFDSCLNALSLHEMSRRTGIGIYTLRKFATRQSNSIREETWDKIYPYLKPYLVGSDDQGKQELPRRVGPTARRHAELVDLLIDQKILLDTFAVLDDDDRKDVWTKLEKIAGPDNKDAYELSSLTADENRVLGLFDAVPEEQKEAFLLNVVELATLEVRKQRNNFF